MPFLENVLRGRNVPPERLREVAAHYHHFGGRSPINDQCRALLAALREELGPPRAAAARLLGQPQLAPLPRRHAASGWPATACAARSRSSPRPSAPTRAAGSTARTSSGRGRPSASGRRRSTSCVRSTTTRASSSRSSRAWRAALERVPGAARARRPAGVHRPQHPARDGRRPRRTWRSCARRPGWSRRGAGRGTWNLVYQSRSGPPDQPWLEPDIVDHLRALAAAGVAGRRGGADRVRLRPHGGRSTTSTSRREEPRAGARPRAWCAPPRSAPTRASSRMVRELVEERLSDAPVRLHLGSRGPRPTSARRTAVPAGLRRSAGLGRPDREADRTSAASARGRRR